MHVPTSLKETRQWERFGKCLARGDQPAASDDPPSPCLLAQALLEEAAQNIRIKSQREMKATDVERAKVQAELNRESASGVQSKAALRVQAKRENQLQANLNELNARRTEGYQKMRAQQGECLGWARKADETWRIANKYHRERPVDFSPFDFTLAPELTRPFDDPLTQP